MRFSKKKYSRKRSRKGVKQRSYKRRKTYSTKHTMVRKHHKHQKPRVAGGYKRLNALQADRYHVKAIFRSEGPQAIQYSTLPAGSGFRAVYQKIKMNSWLGVGHDYTTSVAHAFINPSDIQDYLNNYSAYRTTSSKLEMWIEQHPALGDSKGEDTSPGSLVNFDLCIVPVAFNVTLSGSAVPWTSWDHMIAQPYAKVMKCKYLNTGKTQHYIKRFMPMHKLYSDPDGGANADWSAILGTSVAGIGNPARLCHWHIGIIWQDQTDVAAIRTFTISFKLTQYTSLYGRRLTPDPGDQVMASEIGAKALQLIQEQKKVQQEEEEEDDEGTLVEETKAMSLGEEKKIASPPPVPVAASLPLRGVSEAHRDPPKGGELGGGALRPQDVLLRRLLTNVGLPKT